MSIMEKNSAVMESQIAKPLMGKVLSRFIVGLAGMAMLFTSLLARFLGCKNRTNYAM